MAHPLTKFRQENHLSQPELARLIGVGRSTIHRWESGERKIKRDLLPAISKKTGIPADQLRPDIAKLFGGAQ